jgi:magnesium chelatase family protein
MVASVSTVAFQGVDVRLVDVQVQISSGLPAFTIVGLPDKAVAESKERVRAALHALGLSLPPKRLTVNLAPADLAKEGSHFDLPIALGLLGAMDVVPKEELSEFLVLGELSLDASIRPVAGVLPAAMHANANNKTLICPQDCGSEAAWAGDVEILAPGHLLQLINHIKGTQVLSRPQIDSVVQGGATSGVKEDRTRPDLADVKGQESAKRALEIAAAGGHNLLLVGPPGSGKSMLSSCLPGILPELTPHEALEVSIIHSLAGTLPEGGILKARPYRDPHHSASQPALIGGGHKIKPGEISLAHNGVLFLDELPEFARATLESLRQPLETGETLIARANHHATFPARFQLIAAMNPCRCGYLGDPEMECTKAPKCGQDYGSKISGPMMDRIDMQVFVPPVSVDDLQNTARGESTQTVAQRIDEARKIQGARYVEHFKDRRSPINAYADGAVLEEVAALDDEAKDLLNRAMTKAKLSARAYFRILRVARTIADLDSVKNGQNIDIICKTHIAEALSYRRSAVI